MGRVGLLIGMLVVCWLGCDRAARKPDTPGSEAAAAANRETSPLQLLVVSDPDLADGIGKQWAARSESPLAIHQTSEAQLREVLREDRLRLEEMDAIIYPAALSGTLVMAEQLAVVPEGLFDRAAYAREEVFPLIQRTAVRWGQQRFAVPLGMPVVMLAYRSDLLPAGTELPVDWETWGAMTRGWKSSELGQGDDAVSVRPLLQTLAPGHAVEVFLARAAATVRHRSQYSTLFDADTMRPRIDTPAFVKTLQQVVDDCQASGGPSLLTPSEAFAELVAGRAAMVIGRPVFRGSSSDETLLSSEGAGPSSEGAGRRQAPALPEAVRFARLPGALSMYNATDDRWDARRADESTRVPLIGVAGRMGSVVQASRRKRAAWNLLLLLSGPQWSAEIAASSLETAPFRRSHQDRASAWTGPDWNRATVDSWVRVLTADLAAHDWLQVLRIPGYDEYLSTLDQAVREAVEGTRTAQESLSWAAGEWDAVTESRGRDSQKTAYRRSIGLDP